MNFFVHLVFGFLVGLAGIAYCFSQSCFADLSLLEILGECFILLVVCVLGSTLSDVDSRESFPRRGFSLAASGVIGGYLFFIMHIPGWQVLAVFIVSLFLLAGAEMRHRGWMHSWVTGGLYAVLVWFSSSWLGVFDPDFYALLGFGSVLVHLTLDGIPLKII